MEKTNRIQAVPGENPLASKIDYEEVRRLIALLEEKNLSLFELEVEGLKIKISRNTLQAPHIQPFVSASPPSPAPSPDAAPVSPAKTEEEMESRHIVTSPMVGTFYRAPTPNVPPFVDIGDVVKKGQTLCIIEAMKLMNEIESEADGVIEDIFVENAKPVEYGQKLFAIRATA